MEIEDNGKGFEMAAVDEEGKSLSGNGIRNMKKRAEELGGELIINSAEGKGSSLSLKFTI